MLNLEIVCNTLNRIFGVLVKIIHKQVEFMIGMQRLAMSGNALCTFPRTMAGMGVMVIVETPRLESGLWRWRRFL
jgi:hypothetical protein